MPFFQVTMVSELLSADQKSEGEQTRAPRMCNVPTKPEPSEPRLSSKKTVPLGSTGARMKVPGSYWYREGRKRVS